ncbi:dockerin type I domain-containing protein [Ruminococcus sp.]|uniref:dockerin type I domain-containing protein n=1 Tax=Ruminococcus sp. TaxID=41978 RepID=UPI0025D7428E|nr:dockerin type I domain-containing protein [Ruminococcus sp.]
MKIKTLMSIAATAALAASSVGITAHGEAGLYLIGDINGDGIVDSADACSALAAYAYTSSGKESPLFTYQESAADLNGDSQVDAVDASLILSYYAWASVSDENPIMTDFLEKNGFKQKADEEEKPAEQTDNGGAPANEAAPAAPAPVAEYVPQRIDSEYEEWFWIGDSRTVGMARSIAIDYIAKVGAGIKLFRDNAQSIYQIRNKTVIINLGVNDLDSGAYLRLYNSMPDEFLDNNTVIFMSVNPCDGNRSDLNGRIDAFNNAMRDGLDSRIQFLDSNAYLRYYGFGTTDGLHYTDATYADIYNFVFDSLIGEE